MPRAILILLSSTFLLIGTACSGSGDAASVTGGGSGSVAGSFVADQSSPGPNTVSIAQTTTSGNMVTLQVSVTDTSNVHTAAFDVLFDDSLVEYVGYSIGSFLEQNGNVPLYQVGPGPGRLGVGVIRSGNTGANAVGSQALLNLIFRVTDVGQSQVSVVNATLRDENLNDIQGVAWFGGSLIGS